MIGYLVAKNILSFVYAHENDTFDNLFLPELTTTFAALPRALGISHLNKTFHCSAEGLVPYQILLMLFSDWSKKEADCSFLSLIHLKRCLTF